MVSKNPHRDKMGTIPMDVVLSFKIADPEESAHILEAIAPTTLPRFNGEGRVVIGADVRDLHRFLDKGNDADLESLAQRILNTVDPTLPGHQVLTATVDLVRAWRGPNT